MSLFYQNVLHFSNKSVNFGAESNNQKNKV